MMTSQFPWLKIYRNADAGAGGGSDAGAAAGAAAGAGDAGGADKGADKTATGADNAKKEGGDAKTTLNKDAAAANDALADAKAKDSKGDAGAADDKLKDDAKADDKGDGKDGDKSDDKKADEVDYTKEAGEVYKDLKYPEGFEVQKELVDPALELFKKHKINPAVAQEIVNEHIATLAKSEGEWIKEVNSQWDTFTTDAEFYKDGKLTPEATQAYGTVRTLNADTESFFEFLKKNGGMFHPGFKHLVKLVKAGNSEGGIKQGKETTEKGGAKSFYAKSNYKK